MPLRAMGCLVHMYQPRRPCRPARSDLGNQEPWSLEDFLEPPALNECEQQGLIKAFETTYDLAWNTLRDLLRSQGDASLLGSRDTLREAFRLGLIEQGEAWMLMLQDRLTSHTDCYLPCFQQLRSRMEQRVQEEAL
jgi:nucleotidyltransferase substrate binding protein (TIGR01987 family)